jgi:mannose-6-phosphate isomerase-like protein (cupin superfamily)
MSLVTPQFLATGEGDPYWITEANLTVKFSGKDTGGAYTLIELTAPRGMQIAPHTHVREDEVFLVITGAFRIFCDGQPFDLEQGDCVFLPRGLPHWFEVKTDGFRAIEIINPGGFENMLADLGDLSARPHSPGSFTPEAMARAMEVTRRHGHIISPGAAGMPGADRLRQRSAPAVAPGKT